MSVMSECIPTTTVELKRTVRLGYLMTCSRLVGLEIVQA